MPQYDITIASADPAPPFAATGFMLEGPPTLQDITPASTRRSDGDARYLTIQSESFWSQNDWSAGYGLTYPADATSFEEGPADTLTPHTLRAAFAPVAAGGGLSINVPMTHVLRHEGRPYCVQDNKLYSLAPFATTWALEVALPAAVTSLVSYRGAIWIAFGSAAGSPAVRRYVAGGGAGGLTVPAGAPLADRLCAYGSMLSYTHTLVAGAITSLRLNRYDPENTTAIPDVGVFPYPNGQKLRSLVVVGGDLYAVFEDGLWRFTSANGNAGIVQGPLDSWVVTGGATAAGVAGRAIAYQGALYYSLGGSLRRYQPGGQPRTIWPLPGRLSVPQALSATLDLCNFAVIEDRLWIATRPSVADGLTHTCPLLVWDGAGVHHVADARAEFGTAFPIADHFLVGADWLAGAVVSGLASVGAFQASFAPFNLLYSSRTAFTASYQSGSRWYSSRLDFGMLDIEKSLTQVGLAYVAAPGHSVIFAVSVDGGAFVDFVAQAVPSATHPFIVYYKPPTGRVVVGRVFRFRLTFDMGGNSSASPEIVAITAIPNPINPLRRGGRMTLLVSEAAQDHTGRRVYADEAAVATALALVRSFRTQRHPLLLTWVDGAEYLARFNTLTVRRLVTSAGSAPHWAVDCDWQELS